MSKKRTLLLSVPAFLLFLLLAFPFAYWQFSPESGLDILVWEKEAYSGRKTHPLEWLFLYRKDHVTGNRTIREGDPNMILFSGDFSFSSINEAIEEADRMKRAALESVYAFWDGSVADEAASPALRSRIEQFLQVDFSGWTLKYDTDEGPSLVFISLTGERVTLQGGTHFNGFAPSVFWEGNEVSVKTYLPVYRTTESTSSEVSVDLHLTEAGEDLLRSRGIPTEIPLIMEHRSPLGKAGFSAISFSLLEGLPGSHRVAGRLFYKAELALFSNNLSELYWRIFLPWLDSRSRSLGEDRGSPHLREEPVRFVLDQAGFRKVDPKGGDSSFYLQGVNLGPAVPGRWFTQFPEDEHLYYRWFTQMKEMNLNTVRIYTLLPPSFYRAFELFNQNHQEDPLYLIQEIWPEEHPPGENYLDSAYDAAYREEIRLNVDALHGRAQVAPRTGRAWGEYTADISPWLLAWLVGRELEPDEVLTTNALNPDSIYRGKWLSAPEGPATEAWLASACDLTVAYERENYGSSRPVGIVSWPILDRLSHPVEWIDPALEGRSPANDKAVVDIERILVEDASFGGFFGGYHIYPNYPDFMNNQSSYASYTDQEGTFRYGGYLQEFMASHTKYPAIIAEYGISTSAATAHLNPDGYHHGGLTEEIQGQGIIRMDQAARREGFSGTLIFEWIDEWAKKTWTTEPFMIPYDRQALWQNALDPEQNYGIMAMEGISRRGENSSLDTEGKTLMTAWGSESHLYLEIPDSPFTEGAGKILIGLDSYNPMEGLRQFPGIPEPAVPTGIESLVELSLKEDSARILNISSYSIAEKSFRSRSGDDQEFVPLTYLVNRGYVTEKGETVPPGYTDWSRLHRGAFPQNYYSVFRQEKGITIRIPWTLLNVSDPSSAMVLDDPGPIGRIPERDGIRTARSREILIYSLALSDEGSLLGTIPAGFAETGDALSFVWEPWDVPVYRQREKDSVALLGEYFSRVSP